MSHELRTPLNSLLILAQDAGGECGGQSDAEAGQVRRDHSLVGHGPAGADQRHPGSVEDRVRHDGRGAERVSVSASCAITSIATFRHVADGKRLEFSVEIEPDLPRTMTTDIKRLQQVLKNLLSNALKFTERGSVALRDRSAPRRAGSRTHPVLNSAEAVVAFSVQDTGIGIPLEKQRIIFEAFQQADGTTSRKYGGTGLGLSISREIARLLGGEIRLQSVPGEGSTFTLLPAADVLRPRAAIRSGRTAGRRRRRRSRRVEVIAATRLEAALLAGADSGRRPRKSIPATRCCWSSRTTPPSPASCWTLAHEKGLKALLATRGEMGLAMAREIPARAPSRSTSACPILPAGRCWTSSSTIRKCATSRCTCSPFMRTGAAVSNSARASYSRKAEGREVIDEVLAGYRIRSPPVARNPGGRCGCEVPRQRLPTCWESKA